MPAILIIRNATATDEGPQTQLQRDVERWRLAVDIVQRLREAGIICELSGAPEMRN